MHLVREVVPVPRLPGLYREDAIGEHAEDIAGREVAGASALGREGEHFPSGQHVVTSPNVVVRVCRLAPPGDPALRQGHEVGSAQLAVRVAPSGAQPPVCDPMLDPDGLSLLLHARV